MVDFSCVSNVFFVASYELTRLEAPLVILVSVPRSELDEAELV
jgi:hypothetical protein